MLAAAAAAPIPASRARHRSTTWSKIYHFRWTGWLSQAARGLVQDGTVWDRLAGQCRRLRETDIAGELQWTAPVEDHVSTHHKTTQTKDVVRHRAPVTALQATIRRTTSDLLAGV